MRVNTLVITVFLLLFSVAWAADDVQVNILDTSGSAAVTVAAKAKGSKGPGFLLDLLKDLLKSAGDEIEEANDESEMNVDGDANEVTRIDTINININIGDVEIEKSEGGSFPGFGGFGRLWGGFSHDEGNGRFGRFFNNMNPQGNGPGPDMQMDGHHTQMDMPHPPMPGMEGTMNHPGGGPGMEGHHGGMMGQMPERMEIFSQIPPEVDAGFIEFIMHVGELAWKHPEFRERLEQLVMRMDNAGEEHHRGR